MGNSGKFKWLATSASFLSIITVLLNGMGFLTIQTFILRMGLPSNFFEDTPFDYFQWGAKAIVALVVTSIEFVVLAAILTAVFSFIFRHTIYRFGFIKKFHDKVVEFYRSLLQKMPSTQKTTVLFIITFSLFIIFFISQLPVISQFLRVGRAGQSYLLEIPEVFNTSNQSLQNNYRYFSVFIIISISIILFFSEKARVSAVSGKFFANLHTGAIIALLIFSLALWAMPYRLMSHNEFETVLYNKDTSFVISEKDTRVFIYTPGYLPFLVEKNDSLLKRSGKRYYQNIFEKKKEE